MSGRAKQPITPELLKAVKDVEFTELEKKKKGMAKGQVTRKTKEAITLVLDKGMSEKAALMVATGNPNPSYEAISKFREKVAAWSLKHPKNLKLASNTLVKFAAGEDVNGIKPKASDVKAAAERIVDASDPIIKRTENLNVNIDFSPVDLSKYRRT